MDILSNLSAIGFTEYEAKVYLALLKEYPATGYQIASRLASRARWSTRRWGGSTRGAVLKSKRGKPHLPAPAARCAAQPADLFLRPPAGRASPDLNTLYLAQDEGYLDV